MTEKDIKMSYTKEKTRLIISAGMVGLPKEFNKKERQMQLKGVLPKDWNIHHIKPKCMGGLNEVSNLAIMKMWNHQCLHDYLEDVFKAQKEVYGIDFKFMENYAKKFGAVPYSDVAKRFNGNVPTLRVLKNRSKKQIRLER